MERKIFSETFLRFLLRLSPRRFTVTWVTQSLGGKLIFSSETEPSLQEGCSWIQPRKLWAPHSLSYRNIRRNSLSQLLLRHFKFCVTFLFTWWKLGSFFLKPRTKGIMSRVQLRKLKCHHFNFFFLFSATEGPVRPATREFWAVTPPGWDLPVHVLALSPPPPPAL